MASKSPEADGMTELCERCGRETPHTVSVELRTESAQEENAEFSREPYRVAECRTCSEEKSQRMNNA